MDSVWPICRKKFQDSGLIFPSFRGHNPRILRATFQEFVQVKAIIFLTIDRPYSIYLVFWLVFKMIFIHDYKRICLIYISFGKLLKYIYIYILSENNMTVSVPVFANDGWDVVGSQDRIGRRDADPSTVTSGVDDILLLLVAFLHLASKCDKKYCKKSVAEYQKY